MNKANLWTILVGIALVVLPELLTQTDVVLSPLATLMVRIAILATGVIARYLPAEGQVQKIEITTPVPTTDVTPTEGGVG